MPNNNPDWTQERIQFVRDNYKTMLASDIAKALGNLFSRNAIIGKAGRLGLRADFRLVPHRKRTGELRTRVTKVRPRARILEKWKETMEELRIKRLVGLVDILQLEVWHCREIVQEKPGVLYCGHHKADGSSYCLEHHNKNHNRLSISKVEKYYGL